MTVRCRAPAGAPGEMTGRAAADPRTNRFAVTADSASTVADRALRARVLGGFALEGLEERALGTRRRLPESLLPSPSMPSVTFD